MKPFQFHLKVHWRYPQSLDSLLPWTETISAHLEWLQNPTNVLKGSDLHPKDHSIQVFTDASNEGWGAHIGQASTKGLWSTTIVDRQFREDRTLCPVPALRYYLDQSKDLRCLDPYFLLYPRREAGILWIHHRCRLRPQRFLVSDLQSTFLSRFHSYLPGGLIWWRLATLSFW